MENFKFESLSLATIVFFLIVIILIVVIGNQLVKLFNHSEVKVLQENCKIENLGIGSEFMLNGETFIVSQLKYEKWNYIGNELYITAFTKPVKEDEK